MFTAKGEEVRVRHLRISERRAEGVGWVRAVSWVGCVLEIGGYGRCERRRY